MKIFVSGSLAYDRIMDFPGRFAEHLNPRKLHLINLSFAAKSLKLSFGGTAGNIGYSLALLKHRACLIGNLGADGKDYLARLHRLGLDTSHIRLISSAQTAGAYIITDRDDNQITAFFAGAMNHHSKLPKSGRDDLAIVSADASQNIMAQVAHFRKTHTPYVFDPGQQITALSTNGLARAIRGAKVVIGNDYEMDLLVKRARFRPKSDQVVVTTLGARGSVIKTVNKMFSIPPVRPKKVVDPTGAGDAYRAGLLSGISRGWDWPKSGRLASLVAAFAVQYYGTQKHRFNWRGILKSYKKNFGESL
ncbi:MAG: carbohydrate kinase family protein [Candidatus Doudnabacteria bacterium]|nr:carbohydrate kinase family protein [Candidatus Doudnabacteria bacterium]